MWKSDSDWHRKLRRSKGTFFFHRGARTHDNLCHAHRQQSYTSSRWHGELLVAVSAAPTSGDSLPRGSVTLSGQHFFLMDLSRQQQVNVVLSRPRSPATGPTYCSARAAVAVGVQVGHRLWQVNVVAHRVAVHLAGPPRKTPRPAFTSKWPPHSLPSWPARSR